MNLALDRHRIWSCKGRMVTNITLLRTMLSPAIMNITIIITTQYLQMDIRSLYTINMHRDITLLTV